MMQLIERRHSRGRDALQAALGTLLKFAQEDLAEKLWHGARITTTQSDDINIITIDGVELNADLMDFIERVRAAKIQVRAFFGVLKNRDRELGSDIELYRSMLAATLSITYEVRHQFAKLPDNTEKVTVASYIQLVEVLHAVCGMTSWLVTTPHQTISIIDVIWSNGEVRALLKKALKEIHEATDVEDGETFLDMDEDPLKELLEKVFLARLSVTRRVAVSIQDAISSILLKVLTNL